VRVRHHPSDFFATLGRLAGSQRENQLSRTFQACFSCSAGFRRRVLEAVAAQCNVRVDIADEWECLTEEAHVSGGRLDIVLRSTAPAAPEFRLESKVGSKLTLAQLTRYQARSPKQAHLIAVTQRRPEVPRADLTRRGIRTLRWQDVYHAVTQPGIGGPVDRFIARQFADYLEGQGMAYREQPTVAELEQAGRVFAAIGANYTGIAAKDAFATLQGCSDVLRDLSRDIREEFATIAAWKLWGPSYFCWDDDAGVVNHTLGVTCWIGSGRQFRSAGWGFSIDRKARMTWSTWRFVGDDEVATTLPIRRVVQGGRLSPPLLLDVVRKQLREWKFS
jgi:hypothetical protein